MKLALLIPVIALLGTLAYADTPTNQIIVGGGFFDTDSTGVYGNNYTSSSSPTSTDYGQAAKYSPTLEANGKYTRTLSLDTNNALKFGVGIDNWLGFYAGSSSYSGTSTSIGLTKGAGQSGQDAGMVVPFVEYLGYGADIVFSVPIYYYSPGDNGGFNTFKYAYSEAAYFPTNNPDKPASSNSVLTNTELKLTYKFSFNSTAWISGGVDTLLTIVPTPWLTFVKPQVAGAYGPVQLNIVYDFYNGYYDWTKTNSGTGTVSGSNYYDTFLEPKLTVDLGFLNLKGLQPYTSAKISLASSEAQYANGNPFHNTWIQPGLVYSLAVKGVGKFLFDAGWRFKQIDSNTSSYSTDAKPYSDLRILAAYSLGF